MKLVTLLAVLLTPITVRETPKPRTRVDAAQIRQWILADGKPTELCH